MTFPQILSFAFSLLLWMPPAYAQDASDGTLHVLRPIIHTEQAEAELCLEFDHALDVSEHGRLASNVKLESNNKPVPTPTKSIAASENQLCLLSLEHEKEYRLTVTNLRGATGEKLSGPYSLTFTVPSRHPSLAFVNNANSNGVLEGTDDPVLRSINVENVQLELYHVTDPARMAEAWTERLQTTLAPSESATFARDNGKLVWQGALTFDDANDKTQEQKTPLQENAGDLPLGLYLVVATAPDLKVKKTDLVPTAAVWLLRSHLDIRAIRAADGIEATTQKTDATSPLKGVHLMLLDRNQQTLADAKSDASGLAFLPLPDDRRNDAVTLIGTTDAGDVDFFDTTQSDVLNPLLPLVEAGLENDKNFYAPQGLVNVALTAHDIHGHIIGTKGSTLQVLRSDGSLYSSTILPEGQNGITHIGFPAPATDGVWPLKWMGSDGGLLAESTLHVTTNSEAPRVELTADRTLLSPDGDINLTLKSVDKDNAPAPYIAGRVMTTWTIPDHIFAGNEGYRFGTGAEEGSAPLRVASFLTDERGAAHLRVKLNPPQSASPLRAVVLTIISDTAAGALDPPPLTLPLKPKDFIIGIKPLSDGGHFPENSLARFDIIALDENGNRTAVDDLTYQIFEEGRSFDWFQDEGRWNYKPEQQQRRIGGGSLTLSTGADRRMEWPVTAGSYRIEITNADGKLLARTDFSAGWGLQKPEAADPATLDLKPVTQKLKIGVEQKIHFNLEQPAIITAVIADDHIRTLIHEARPAGANDILFTPENGWGDHLNLTLDAEQGSGSEKHLTGRIIMSLPSSTPSPVGAALADAEKPPLGIAFTTSPPGFLKMNNVAVIPLVIKCGTVEQGTYHYTASASDNVDLAGTVSGSMALTSLQEKTLYVTAKTVHAGDGNLRVEIVGPHNYRLSQSWPLATVMNGEGLATDETQLILPQHQSVPTIEKGKGHIDPTLAFLGPEPLFGAPELLTSLLEQKVFLTSDIANHIEALHLWHDALVASRLLPPSRLKLKEDALLMRLLARQQKDGGFPPVPGADSSLADTGSALKALKGTDMAGAKAAQEEAATWLKHRLENTWFDEKERPQRASIYAALAETDHLDQASLRYFSDTSADKSLPPLAAAELALAFARMNDKDKALYWLGSMHMALDAPDIETSSLVVLSKNPFFDPHTLFIALQKRSAELTKKPYDANTAPLLIALATLQNRAGPWRVTVGRDEKNPTGALVINLPEKNAGFAVHNPSDRNLYMSTAKETTTPPPGGPIQRHMFLLDGSEVTGSTLERGEIYIVSLEGPWRADEKGMMFVHDEPGPFLQPLGCALSPLTEGNTFGWLSNTPPSDPKSCEKTSLSLDTLLAKNDEKDGPWRMVYLAKAAMGGSFNLASPQAKALASDGSPVTGTELHLQIK